MAKWNRYGAECRSENQTHKFKFDAMTKRHAWTKAVNTALEWAANNQQVLTELQVWLEGEDR